MFLGNTVILLICQDGGPAISATQKFYSSQMFRSDDVTKAFRAESVPPEWGPTPNIIVHASPFPLGDFGIPASFHLLYAVSGPSLLHMADFRDITLRMYRM